ncbi:hypothetical protein [Marinifilum flexuosum]|uniref:hypothetical protein n=1 Tax=Marinifilum flexuosum TaxID=1117708 RepID=UPI00248FCC47|nr:hypothetical protein [Marinifilum flexuosum]
MKLYFTTPKDEDLAHEAKEGIIIANKEDAIKLCAFFKTVEEHLKNNEYCHMHYQDFVESWNADKDIDIEISVE